MKHDAQYEILLKVELLNVGLVELSKGEYALTIVMPIRTFLVIVLNVACVEIITRWINRPFQTNMPCPSKENLWRPWLGQGF